MPVHQSTWLDHCVINSLSSQTDDNLILPGLAVLCTYWQNKSSQLPSWSHTERIGWDGTCLDALSLGPDMLFHDSSRERQRLCSPNLQSLHKRKRRQRKWNWNSHDARDCRSQKMRKPHRSLNTLYPWFSGLGTGCWSKTPVFKVLLSAFSLNYLRQVTYLSLVFVFLHL